MTGAAGAIGQMLRRRLSHHELRLTDVRADDNGVDELDVTDAGAVEKACRGVDAVVHLGGIAGEGPFEDVLAVNVLGTERVLQAAHRTGVPRVVLASSNHAAGLYERADAGPDGLPDDVPARPDSYYGWSKAAMEQLGRLYHDRCGPHVVCLRIGSCTERPTGRATCPPGSPPMTPPGWSTPRSTPPAGGWSGASRRTPGAGGRPPAVARSATGPATTRRRGRPSSANRTCPRRRTGWWAGR